MLRAQWSDLLPELLQIIFQKLDDPFDVYRCARTCVSWKFVATTILPPPQFLLLSNVGRQASSNQNSCTLFNIQTNQTHEVFLPELEGRFFSSSSFGWLLTIGFNEGDDIRLLNPLTRDQIELPPANQFRDYQNLRVITSTSPSNPDCLVLATHNNGRELAYCRPGDMSWTNVKSSRWIFVSLCLDTIFYQNKFYALDLNGTLFRVFCPIPATKRVSLQPIEFLHDWYKFYLVELDGHLLMVAGYASGFEVYKLNWVDKRWIRMESIGNYAILLGKSSSKSLLVDDHSTNLKANCIYFIVDSCSFYGITNHIIGTGFGFYDMTTNCMCNTKINVATSRLNWFIANIQYGSDLCK